KLLRALATGGVRSVVSMAFRVGLRSRPSYEVLRRRAAAAQGPITTRVDISAHILAKYAAMAEHRSQIHPHSHRFALTPEERKRINPTENFSLRQSRVEIQLPEDDLFAGLR